MSIIKSYAAMRPVFASFEEYPSGELVAFSADGISPLGVTIACGDRALAVVWGGPNNPG